MSHRVKGLALLVAMFVALGAALVETQNSPVTGVETIVADVVDYTFEYQPNMVKTWDQPVHNTGVTDVNVVVFAEIFPPIAGLTVTSDGYPAAVQIPAGGTHVFTVTAQAANGVSIDTANLSVDVIRP